MKKALARHDGAEATMLFERLNATHWVPRRPDLTPWLERELGTHATALLVDAYATLPCHFCQGEWGVCPTCEGVGEDSKAKACPTCAGIALGCCAACNGSGLVNYAGVPVGLRHAVLKARLAHAATIIRARRPARERKGSGGEGSKVRERIGARLPAILAARAMLSNAVRAASGGEQAPSVLKAQDTIPKATRQRVRGLAARLAPDAEIALRVALSDMAELERAAAERGGPGADAAARRASRFLRLAGRKVFVSPVLYRKALANL